MKKTIFTGSAVAIVTPFTEDGVNFSKLGELIEFQIANKTDAIVICGTTGESSTMPDAEHSETIRYAVEKVAGRVPVIAGTGTNDTRHAIALSQQAEKDGADALLLVTPYYNKCSQQGLVLHFNAIAKSVSIPCMLYNVPSRTGVTIAPQTVYELSKTENIVAVKEASGSLAQAMKMVQLCGDAIDIYSGNDDLIVPLLSVGAKGVISVLANVAPEQTHDICEKFFAGDVAGAAKMQYEAMELIDALFCDVNPIPVKEAMNLMGYGVGPLRLPLCEMQPAAKEKLAAALKNYGLLQ